MENQSNIQDMVLTVDAKLYIEFLLGSSKKGKERIFYEDSPKTKKQVEDRLNKYRKIAIEKKAKKENNKYIKYYPEQLAKWTFNISDDYEELRTYDNKEEIIGTTLVNFLNKVDIIIQDINIFEKKLKQYNIIAIRSKKDRILSLLNKYKIEDFNIDNIYEGLTMALYNDYKYFDDNKEIETILNLAQELFLLEDNYFEKEDLKQFILDIINNVYTENEMYEKILLYNIKRFENKIQNSVNNPLKYIVNEIFNCFYKHYNYITLNNSLYEFFNKLQDDVQEYMYNKYYKNLYEYMIEIEDVEEERLDRKFNNIELIKVVDIFVNSLRNDIVTMLENYDTRNIDFGNTNLIKEDKKVLLHITSLNELYFYSQYCINEDGRALKYCKLCGRFFITDYKVSENNCRRIYEEGNEKLSCCDIIKYNSNKGYGRKRKIENRLAKIKLELIKMDCKNKTSKYSIFQQQLYKFIKENKYEKTEEHYKEILEWLDDYLSKVKNEN